MAAMVDFQSLTGPGDKLLPNDEVRGYQPVSRIGEVVINSFVDAYEFSQLPGHIQEIKMDTEGGKRTADDVSNEAKPMFHEWATVQPGMVCVARKRRTAHFRQFTAAETAVPVIGCAACLVKADEESFFFAGITRSKSVRAPDDGIGPAVDEYFTLSIGGMATVLNTSGGVIHPGDLVEWTFSHDKTGKKRPGAGPRRIALVSTEDANSSKIVGRALSFAKSGESYDILIKQ
tara:strand:+ start:292 stop:987 length:696 start_codon:yes stop_codon:yes gene_type:complete